MGFFVELGAVIDGIIEGLEMLFGDDDSSSVSSDEEIRRARAEQR